MNAYGIERAGKRKEYIDPRDIVCPRLFEAICSEWDKAVSRAWLEHDGLIGGVDD